jgi:hypothetical protein
VEVSRAFYLGFRDFHNCADFQRDPKDNTKTKDRLEYYLWLAKIAEKGKISSIFFADSYGNHEIYAGNADAQFKGGSHVAKLEPTLLVSAMATVTKSLGFGITGSTSYIRKSMGPVESTGNLIVNCSSLYSSTQLVNFRPYHQRQSG